MARPRGANRRRFVLALVLLTAVTLITLDTRNGRSGPLGAVGRLAHTIVSPIQGAVSSVTRPVGDWWSGMVDSGSIKKAAVDRGMVTLLEHGAYKVARGITTAAEVLSVTAEDLH